MTIVTTKLPLSVGGSTLPAGSPLDVTEAEAIDLVEAGRATPAPDATPAPESDPTAPHEEH